MATTTTVGIMGATGRTGGWVLEDCLHKGYKCVALVRNPDKLNGFKESSPTYNDSNKDLLQIVQGDATTVEGIQALLNEKVDVLISVVGSSSTVIVVKKIAEALLGALTATEDDIPRVIWMTSTGINEATEQAKSYPLFGTPSTWLFGYGGFGLLQFKILIPYIIGQELWDDMGYSEDVIRANENIFKKTTIVRPTNMWPVSENAVFSEEWWKEGGSKEDLKYTLIKAEDPPPGKWIFRRAIAAALIDLVTDASHDGTAKSLFAAVN